MLIPGLIVALGTIVVMVVFFNGKIAVVEIVAPILISLLVGTTTKFFVNGYQTWDQEFWGAWTVHATYREPWTEWTEVDDYCTRTVPDGQGGTTTETYKCGSHLEYTHHPAEYVVEMNTGDRIPVDESHYLYLRNWWSTHPNGASRRSQGEYDNYHRVQYGFHYGGDGYLHTSSWPGTEETFNAATISRRYVNKVQAAEASLFNFREITPEEKQQFQLFDYPPIYDFYRQDAILGPDGAMQGAANDLLMKWNAKIGGEKQVKIFILTFRDQPIEAAILQRDYWKGGNKNEFVICRGVDNRQQVQWAYVFSWCEDEMLKVDIKDLAVSQPDLVSLVDDLIPEIRSRFVRKSFADFDYLELPTPLWGQILSFFLCLIGNVGIGCWLVKNGFSCGDDVEMIRSRLQRRRL